MTNFPNGHIKLKDDLSLLEPVLTCILLRIRSIACDYKDTKLLAQSRTIENVVE
jgi:hypothetical protein